MCVCCVYCIYLWEYVACVCCVCYMYEHMCCTCVLCEGVCCILVASLPRPPPKMQCLGRTLDNFLPLLWSKLSLMHVRLSVGWSHSGDSNQISTLPSAAECLHRTVELVWAPSVLELWDQQLGRSKDSLQESVLSLHHVSLSDGTWVTRLGVVSTLTWRSWWGRVAAGM